MLKNATISTSNTVNITVKSFDIKLSQCEKILELKFDHKLTFDHKPTFDNHYLDTQTFVKKLAK